MKIITVATHSQAYFPVLEESAKRYGVDLVVLGWGEKWQGFGWKLKLIKDYLGLLSLDETVVVLDAFDTFISGDIDELEKKFKKLNIPMLCASERKHKNPVHNWVYEKIFNNKNDYPKTPTGYNYLNAGTWISSAGYVLRLLNMATIGNTTNDQKLLTSLYLRGYVSIDYNCELFTCIKSEFDLSCSSKGLKNRFTETYPYVIHAPIDVSMKKVLSLLEYNPINYTLKERAWKYAYSILAFWGNRGGNSS